MTIRTFDVIKPSRWMVAILSNGHHIQIRTYSVQRAISMIQEVIGDEFLVMALFDGTTLYQVEWQDAPSD